jgi:hypothetical protein
MSLILAICCSWNNPLQMNFGGKCEKSPPHTQEILEKCRVAGDVIVDDEAQIAIILSFLLW